MDEGDWERMYGKTPTHKMIETVKNYKLTLTETQARELYEFLRGAKDVGHLSVDRDLILVYNELKNLFDTGIR